MKTIKNTLVALILLRTIHLISMEYPPQQTKAVASQASFDSLPADVKRLLIPMIASGNVAEVATTILSLNRTSKCVRSSINNPGVLISILERMPYTFKAIALVKRLQKTKLPVAHNPAIIAWVDAARKRLESGTELYRATVNVSAAEVAELLRNRNININSEPLDQEKQSALMVASFERPENIVGMLLEAGADVNLQEEDGWTALMFAVNGNNPTIVERLLIAGADASLRNNARETARDIALLSNYQNIVEMLDAYSFMAGVLQTEPEEVTPLLPPSSKKPRTE